MWKFHDFSIIQIFREINLGILEVQNLPFSQISLEALNFDFDEFLPFLKAEIYPKQ